MRHLLLASLLLLLLSACQNQASQEEAAFDAASRQAPVTTHAQIDALFKTLKPQPFDRLPPEYLAVAGIRGPWKPRLAQKEWYLLQGTDALRFVVGTFRLGEFLPHDDHYTRQLDLPVEERRFYLCIDRRVLHKLLDLLVAMPKQGLDPGGLSIKHGFRHPAYNTAIGGATKSRHQWGEAIDLFVGDVNRDGVANDQDKAPLLKLLDRQIIGNQGGVGKYPGTNVIHMDVRGFRARWDQQ